MTTGYINIVTDASQSLTTNFGAVFSGLGMKVFDTAATIRLIQEGFHLGFNRPHRLPETLVLVAMTFAAMVYYTSPIPGIGKSLTDIVKDSCSDLAKTIDSNTDQNVGIALSKAVEEANTSTWAIIKNPLAIGRFFTIEVALSVMQATALGVISLGFIVIGILVLVGQLFIPFILVPSCEWLARNWIRCFIQYCFYPIVANGFIFVFAQIWLNFTTQFPGGISDPTTIAAAWTVIITTAFAGLFGLFQIPAIVSHLFSGGSGAGSWRGL